MEAEGAAAVFDARPEEPGEAVEGPHDLSDGQDQLLPGAILGEDESVLTHHLDHLM
jgi:hypothetical protein